MDWLNYHHLLYFWTVVREGGVSRAAEKLRLAQPTVSGQLKALEDALTEVVARTEPGHSGMGTTLSANALVMAVMRANLLDELRKQYVTTATAKGVPPMRALVKYPLRMSLNFFIADIGSILPAIISGAEITAIVLSLETTGPMLIKALQSHAPDA